MAADTAAERLHTEVVEERRPVDQEGLRIEGKSRDPRRLLYRIYRKTPYVPAFQLAQLFRFRIVSSS